MGGSTLNPSKLLAFRVKVASVHQDPKGAILFAYFPAPGPRQFQRLFAIPLPYFIAHCPREHAAAGEYFTFYAGLKGSGRSKWSEFFFEFRALEQQWLDELPGWKKRMPAMIGGIEAGLPASDAREHRVRGACAELFVAGDREAAGGHRAR